MLDQWKFLFDPEYRGELIALVVERALPITLGVGITAVGVAFVLAGSKTAQTVVGAVTTVATKGKI